MSFLVGLILVGVLAVVLAVGVLFLRLRASQQEPWPDENPKEDESARQNALRILTIGLVAFALVMTTLGAYQHAMALYLPLAATALIAILAVRIRMQRGKAPGTGQKRYW